MKKIISLFGIVVLLCSAISNSKAQCSAGLSEVVISVQTDDYGYEGYWELVPAGNACGSGTIQSGGNLTQIGCLGGGSPYTADTGNGYANNTTINTTPSCYATGNVYDIKYIDDYGDGGFVFTVKINGFPIYSFTGSGGDHTFTFINKPPPSYDLSVTKIEMPLYGSQGNKTIAGSIFNYGITTISSFDLNYSINNGAAVTQNISGVSIPAYTSYQFAHPTLWNVSENGTFNIDVWATNLNGSNPDTNLTNDHGVFTLIIGDPIPNIIDDYTHADFTFTTIANSSDGILEPRDLDFHPILNRNELWIVLKSTEESGGKTAKISNAGQTGQSVLVQQDGNAWHFMSLPTGIAFSDNGNFSTSPGVLDANHGDGHFTGPTLWSSDPAIYAMPSGGNGSHLDMLHQCPYAMGVTWEKDNAFWVFDGFNGDLMRCDFVDDHGPGNHDHSDGRVRSYEDIPVGFADLDVPCHMAFDDNKQWLYIVNGSDNKIYRMDITTGSETGSFIPYLETLAEHSIYTGTTNEVYISTGLTQPCGIDIIGNRLVVSDFTTGEIVIYDCSGPTAIELVRIATGTTGVQGVKIGPDGKIWYVNKSTNEVKRIDYNLWTVGVNESTKSFSNITAYPNPSADQWNISGNSQNKITNTALYNMLGEYIENAVAIQNGNSFSLHINNQNLASGSYFLKLINTNSTQTIRLVKQ